MTKNLWRALAIGVALIASWLVFLVVAFGGLEPYQPAFELAAPNGYRGLVCATSRPGTTEDTSRVVRHEIRSDGLLEVDGDILRSHRPIKILYQDSVSAALVDKGKITLLSAYTENAPSGEWYAVMWLGGAEEWGKFLRENSGKHLCLGRFGK
ncbi:MAG: hypothetical protein ING64_07595 [Rhodocyclaceae bacterium]|nr:hypothetical protein [Rhodocyclaceae bacterium]